MTDSQRVIRDLLKEVIQVVNAQAGMINEVGDAVNGHAKAIVSLTAALEDFAAKTHRAMTSTGEAIVTINGSVVELQNVEGRRWAKYVKRMRYDPSSGCCHNRKL